MVTFMLVDVARDPDDRAFLHLFGRTEDGTSVHVMLTGFHPYFWARKPAQLRNFEVNGLCNAVNRAVSSRFRDTAAVQSITVHQREHFMFYKPENATESMLKIVVNEPADMFNVKKYFGAKIRLPNGQTIDPPDLFEEQGLSYQTLFMRDYSVGAFTWLQIPFVDSDNCASVGSVKVLDRDDIAPLRLFTFDIETLSLDPLVGECIQIGFHVKDFGTGVDKLVLDGVLHTGQTDPIDDCECRQYPNEKALLEGFVALVQELDYDISRSYNGIRFDWPFLFKRAEELGVDFKIGRLRGRDGETPGRTEFDICEIIRKEYVLGSYKLNNVCMEFLKNADGQPMTKEDVHYSLIPVLYRGSSADRNRLARYCRKDALLPVLLDERLLLLVRYIEQARVCGVLLYDLVNRGQQVKVFAQIAREALALGLVMPVKKPLSEFRIEGKYEGGLVLDPITGFHEKPIGCLDFSSLYPSVGRWRNYCYTTLIHPDDVAKVPLEDRYKSPKGHWFVKKHVREGILPRMWTRLLAARKVAKGDKKKELKAAEELRSAGNLVEAATRAFAANVQDGRQLALKLVANAAYGFTGVDLKCGGFLSAFQVSESITAEGREALQTIIKWTAEHYPESRLIYGDSVVGDTPVLVRIGESTRVATCEVLARELWSEESEEKARIELHGMEIWTEQGFSPIRAFIRHKCRKPIMRVVTDRGMVDCTTDHSLVRGNGSAATPLSVKVGEHLLHHPYDGPLPDILVDGQPIPTSLLELLTLSTKRDWDGAWSKVEAFVLGMALQSHGVAVRFEPIGTSKVSINPLTTESGRIQSMEVIDSNFDGYVYDFEVDNHHFGVGPGSLIVHNTDSIMVQPGMDNVPDVMKWMHKAATEINAELFADTPMNLEPEKVMYPALFTAKKRYYVGYWESSDQKPDKVMYRGMEVVRRDTCDLLTQTLKTCCELIFLERNIPDAVDVAKKAIQRLYLGEVGLEELIISKTLSKAPEEYSNPQAHVQIVKRMQRRDPHSVPEVGDRVPYVMIGEGVKGKVSDMAEDPLYVLEHDIPINTEFYIENQLRKPLERLFAPIIGAQKTADILAGQHTRKRVRRTPVADSGGLMGFVTMLKVCKECRATYDPAKHKHPLLCPACLGTKGPALLNEKKAIRDHLKVQYDKEFAVCQACQGSDRDPVLCMARTCPQLYRRKGAETKLKRVIQDIEDMGI